jgi:hypothetical protein
LKVDPGQVIRKESLGIVEPDINCIGLAIEGLIGSPAKREQIGIRAQRYVAWAHSEETFGTLFENAIQGIRDDHRAGMPKASPGESLAGIR